MSGATLDLDRYVPGLLTFLGNKLTSQTSAMYRADFQVGAIEWRILSILAVKQPATASDISRICGLDKAAIVRNLETLRKRELVEVTDDPDHGRRRLALLTPAGRQAHDKILLAAIQNERHLLSCLEPEEQTVLIGLLRRLHDHLTEVGKPPSAN